MTDQYITMDTDDKFLSAINTNYRMSEKLREMDELQGKLTASLTIERIWPEAFKHGSCKFGGTLNYDARRETIHNAKRVKVPTHTLVESWFTDGAGNRRYLTIDELRMFKPDEIVHPQYREAPIRAV